MCICLLVYLLAHSFTRLFVRSFTHSSNDSFIFVRVPTTYDFPGSKEDGGKLSSFLIVVNNDWVIHYFFDWLIDNLVDLLICCCFFVQSINQPTNQSINQSVNQSVNQSINQSINQMCSWCRTRLTTVKIDVFNKGLKVLTEGAALISQGRLFHRWGAATEKARSL